MPDASPSRTFNVFIRDLIVHHDRDAGPGQGEFEVVFGAASAPTTPGGRAAVTWQGSVSSGRTYDVAQWTGAVAVPTDGGKLSIAGGGTERDPVRGEALRGGLATFSEEHGWGEGEWWRTTNGRDFDFTFCITPAEEASEAARPVWTGETFDAPGTDQPGPSGYRSILGD